MPREQMDPRLAVPPLPPRHVSRSRLLTALDAAVDVPLVLLAAGPGAGKTVLLSDWVRHCGAPVAWMTVTAADAVPRRFWRLLWTALHSLDKPDEDPAPLARQGDAINRVQSLLAGIPDSPVPAILIIDDAHFLTHANVLDGLDALIRSGPASRLCLMLAARSDPLLPLHRYRLAGQMRELRAADLAMTHDELQHLLIRHGVALTDADIDALLARTEGWVAGARLSAMQMENTEYPARFVSELALGEGSIGEYLVAEVLAGQPEPVRKLLTQTSPFDEVTAPLAEAVTGLDGCADLLAELARSNSFVIPLDAARTRFRYHQLLREILRTTCNGGSVTRCPACCGGRRPISRAPATSEERSTGPRGPATGRMPPRCWPAVGWRTRSSTAMTLRGSGLTAGRRPPNTRSPRKPRSRPSRGPLSRRS